MSELTPKEARSALREFLAMPFLLFSTVFLLGCIAMLLILTPGRFPVQAGDKLVQFSDITAERDGLKAEHTDLLSEANRVASITPTPVLNLIHGQGVMTNIHSARAMSAIETAVLNFSSVGTRSVIVEFVHMDAKSISLSGKVYDNEGRSVQLLASFVDRIRDSKLFTSVSEPEYKQLRDSNGAPYSPFAIEAPFAN